MPGMARCGPVQFFGLINFAAGRSGGVVYQFLCLSHGFGERQHEIDSFESLAVRGNRRASHNHPDSTVLMNVMAVIQLQLFTRMHGW